MNLMVCSDLSAWGLDFPFLTGVINVDFPLNINDYIHRAGWAGRTGVKGIVMSLYNKNEEQLVEKI